MGFQGQVRNSGQIQLSDLHVHRIMIIDHAAQHAWLVAINMIGKIDTISKVSMIKLNNLTQPDPWLGD